MRRIIIASLLIIISFTSFSQARKAVIPYEMVGGKMVIEIEVNGVRKKAVFDTGASKNSITEELMKELRLSVTSTQSVTDVNNNKSNYSISTIAELHLIDGDIRFKGYEALIMKTNPLECFGIDLLIGSEMFAKTIVTIDGKTKTITVTSSEIEPKLPLRNSAAFTKDDYMPLVRVDLDHVSVETLFDTGFGGFFHLRKEDYHKNNSSFNTIAESLSEGSIGLQGKSAGAISNRVLVNRLNFNGAKFFEVVVETRSAPYSLLGVRLLDYGKVTIDYARKRIYFEAYEKEVLFPKPLNDFSLMVENGNLLITKVWSSDMNGIKNGNIVTHINGKPVSGLDFCKSIIVGIPELEVKKRSILTVKTDEGVKKIKYSSKK